MKGLILKDCYQIRGKCRFQLAISMLFALLYMIIVSGINVFFIVYPVLLNWNIIVNLMSFDEKSGWEQYVLTLPVTRRQVVAAKYILAIMGFLGTLVLFLLAALFRQLRYGGTMEWQMVLGASLAGLFLSCFLLPVVFRFGMENGRIIYVVFVLVACGAAGVGSALVEGFSGAVLRIRAYWLLCLALAAALAVGVSYLLSVYFYERREFYKR